MSSNDVGQGPRPRDVAVARGSFQIVDVLPVSRGHALAHVTIGGRLGP